MLRSIEGAFILKRITLLSCALILAGGSLSAHAQSLRSVADLLTPDGRFDTRRAAPGQYDVAGHELRVSEDGTPRLVPAGAATRTNEEWDDRFGMPGVGFYASVVAVAPTGDVIVGGSFTEANGIAMHRLVRWNGRRFHQVGGALNGQPYAIAFADDGRMYVGGYFSRAGNVAARGLAMWDGAAWHPLGTGLETWGGSHGSVSSLAVMGNSLIVGGDFLKAGNGEYRNLARWDGQAWHDVGGGVGSMWSEQFTRDGTVHALAVRDGNLFVAGRFRNTADGMAASSIARWDGTHWHALGAGVEASQGNPGTIRDIALDGDRLFVAGDFEQAGPSAAKNVAVWQNGTWSALGAGLTDTYNQGTVNSITLAGGQVYAGGQFTIAGSMAAMYVARWDGMQWHAIDGGMDSYVESLSADAQGRVYAVGQFALAGGKQVRRAAVVEDGTWRALGMGTGYGSIAGTLHAVVVAPDGDVFVGGQFTHVHSIQHTYNVARWDGTAWHRMGPGNADEADGRVQALALAGDDLFIGGTFTKIGGIGANRIARYHIPSGTFHPLGAGMNGQVNALAVGGDYVYAGGSFSTAGAVPARFIARWNGTDWSTLGGNIEFSGGSEVHAVVVVGSEVVFGGGFARIKPPGFSDFVAVNSIAMWESSGNTWYALNDGFLRDTGFGDAAGEVYSLHFANGSLYAGGRFDRAGTAAAMGVARFGANGWEPVGLGHGTSSTYVYALQMAGESLFAGGSFETTGGKQTRYIAEWDGTEWHSLGSGLWNDGWSTSANGLAADAHSLYVAGRFSSAGDHPASGFAVWRHGAEGVVRHALILLNTRELSFGEVPVERSASRSVTISNSSQAAATLNVNLSVSGPFSIEENQQQLSLAPGASREVTVRFAPTARGEAEGSLQITHNAGNEASPIEVRLHGTGTGARVIVMKYFDPQQPAQTIAAEAGGFVFGTNGYGDRAKAVAFSVPADKNDEEVTLTEVKVWFSRKKAGVDDRNYTVEIFAGTAASGPIGEPIYSQVFSLGHINAGPQAATSPEITTHQLSQPVDVPASFFVSINFGEYPEAHNDMVALGSTGALNRRVAEVWDQDDGGSWANVSDVWAGGSNGWHPWIETVVEAAAPVSNEPEFELPGALALLPNFPNPFNPSTTIQFELPQAGRVMLVVYDALGREVATLVDGVVQAGIHLAAFHAGNLPSGTYFAKLTSGESTFVRKLVLLK